MSHNEAVAQQVFDTATKLRETIERFRDHMWNNTPYEDLKKLDGHLLLNC